MLPSTCLYFSDCLVVFVPLICPDEFSQKLYQQQRGSPLLEQMGGSCCPRLRDAVSTQLGRQLLAKDDGWSFKALAAAAPVFGSILSPSPATASPPAGCFPPVLSSFPSNVPRASPQSIAPPCCYARHTRGSASQSS